MNPNHSRRQFLKDSGFAFGGSWLSANLPVVLAAAQVACSKQQEGAAWVNITEMEAVGFAAIADQIIPPDETPGASEMGVVYFIDEALGSFMQGEAGMLRAGLAELDRRAAGGDFAGLGFDEQTAILKQLENERFFQSMIFLTQAGMFALPAYGGNRDGSGWDLIGFEHRHVWQAPYGYYDEHATEQQGVATDVG